MAEEAAELAALLTGSTLPPKKPVASVRPRKPTNQALAMAAANHPNPTDYSLAQAERFRTEEQRNLHVIQAGEISVMRAAQETGWSPQTITRLFENEKGVHILNRPETRFKRAHRSIRIPRKVFDRVLAKLAN